MRRHLNWYRRARDDLARAHRVIAKKGHVVVAKLTFIGHCSYYALVSWEAHGSYRYAAGMLAIITVVASFSSHDHE